MAPEDPQTEGSYLYEPPHTGHTLHIPADEPVVEGFMEVSGVNVTSADEGNDFGTDHAGSMEELILSTARELGIAVPRYIRPGGPAPFSR